MIGTYGATRCGVRSRYGPIDVLVRSNRIHAIAGDLAASGEWKYAENLENLSWRRALSIDKVSDYNNTNVRDIWLEICVSSPLYFGFQYLHLWTEEGFKLSVDCCKNEVPDILANELVILEDEYYHDSLDLLDSRGLRSFQRIPGQGDARLLLRIELRAKRKRRDIPIFVPTIGEHLNALLS